MSGENGRLIQRLHRLYGNPPIRDGFRNGKATVRQIEQAISQKKDRPFVIMEQDYQPTPSDVAEKND